MGWLVIVLHNLFQYIFIGLSGSDDPCQGFRRFVKVDPSYFLFLLFLDYFFFNFINNIWLFENWALYFFICSL
jgi:hypothetical protein